MFRLIFLAMVVVIIVTLVIYKDKLKALLSKGESVQAPSGATAEARKPIIMADSKINDNLTKQEAGKTSQTITTIAQTITRTPPADPKTVTTTTKPTSSTAVVKDSLGNTFSISSEAYDSMRNWILVNGLKNGAGKDLRLVNGVAWINSGNVENAAYAFTSGKWVKQAATSAATPIVSAKPVAEVKSAVEVMKESNTIAVQRPATTVSPLLSVVPKQFALPVLR
jgi:hypothetical protein